VKEANLKRLHTVRFQLSGILEKEKKKQNYEDSKRSVVAKGLGGKDE